MYNKIQLFTFSETHCPSFNILCSSLKSVNVSSILKYQNLAIYSVLIIAKFELKLSYENFPCTISYKTSDSGKTEFSL